MIRAIQTGFEGAHSLSSVDAKLEFLLAYYTCQVGDVTPTLCGPPSKERPWKVAVESICCYTGIPMVTHNMGAVGAMDGIWEAILSQSGLFSMV